MAILWDLYRLFAFSTIEEENYECEWLTYASYNYLTKKVYLVFRCGVISQHQLDKLPGGIQDLMSRIRPHAVRIVDSWMIPDYLLDR
jgi:acyl-CoA oxidase